MSICFKIIIEFIICVASIIIAITTCKKRKKIRNKLLFITSIIVAIATFTLSFFINDVPTPSINRETNHSSVILSTSDPTVIVEYKISTNNSNDNWIEYKEPIKLTRGAIIYARTKILWYTSDEVFREVYVTENGLVYFSAVEKPIESIKSITATYNYIEPVVNKNVGNHYVGYEIKKDDIKVVGKNLENKYREITDFTYSPKILKKGHNTINIEYFLTDDISVKTNLYVNGDAPTMIKLDAKPTNKIIFSGTVLDSTDFIVKGSYEDGTVKEITGYSISPPKVKEGKNKITITQNGLTDIIEINAVDKGTITENEAEPNNEIEKSNEANVNIKYTGTIAENGDIDYYKFDLEKKGKITIKLTHTKLDNDKTFWIASLFSQEENTIVNLHSTGKNVETTSSPARVSPGVYYVKVSNEYYYSDEKYTLTILYEEEDDSFETEINDDLSSQAMTIQPNQKYTGNLTTTDDVDYFKFSINEKRKVWIDFSHNKKSTSNILWKISLFGDSDGALLDVDSTGESAKITSNRVRLPAGNYYIRIDNNYYWSDSDYTFCVYSEKENINSENEDNGDYELATKINIDSRITGNLQSLNDVDFYKFEIKNTMSVKINFCHKLINDSNTLWILELYSTEFSNALKNDEDMSTIYIQGNSSENISNKWNSLPKGTYYLKVYNRYYYNNDDYTITLS